RLHAGVALDAVLEREQQLHAGQAVCRTTRDRVGNGVDDESRADTGHALIRGLRVQARGLGLRYSLDRLTRVETQFLGHIEAFALRLRQPCQDGEHRSEIEHVRVEVHVAEGRRA